MYNSSGFPLVYKKEKYFFMFCVVICVVICGQDNRILTFPSLIRVD